MEGIKSFLAGWVRFYLADGYMFIPRDGPERGMVKVSEGLPLVRFRDIVEAVIRDGGDEYRDAEVGELSRFSTEEGETAGMVTLTVRGPEGAVTERSVALVAAEERCVLVDAATTSPDSFERYRSAVRLLAETWYLGLGRERQRRFEYTPPAGWPIVGRPHAARYLHPRYPNVDVLITVFDAWPLKLSASLLINRSLVHESADESTAAGTPETVEISPGLTANVTIFSKRVLGAPRRVAHAIATDDCFAYRMHLECTPEHADAALETLRALLRSIIPLPRGQAKEASSSSGHWIE
jgi:hypothetical protein